MRASLRSILALLLLAAAPAGAAELDLGWDSRMVWDSNPLRSPDDEDPDFSVYVGPNVGIRERGRALDYSLSYRLRYEQYVDLSSVNGFEHFANAQATWRTGPRSQLSFRNSFSRTRGLGIDFLEPVPGVDPVGATGELQFRRAPVVRNLATATYGYQLSKLWSFESTLDGTIYEYEDELRQDVLSLRGSGQFTRPVTQRLLVGLGGAFTRQEFDDTPRSLERGTSIVEGFGIASYQFSPTLALSLAGGPAWTQPDDLGGESMAPRNLVGRDGGGTGRLVNPAGCIIPLAGVPAGTISSQSCVVPGSGVFLPGALIPTAAVDPTRIRFDAVDILGDSEDPDPSLTFFGRAALIKTWRTVQGELSYRRSASTSSGIGSTNLDVASVVLSWKPDRQRWRFDARATWTLQTSASDFPGTDILLSPTGTPVWVLNGRVFESDPGGGATFVPNAARVVGVRTLGSSRSDFEVETLLFDLRAHRRVSENLVLTAQTGWWRQESRSGAASGGSSDPRTIDNLRFQVGFTWDLDPIEF